MKTNIQKVLLSAVTLLSVVVIGCSNLIDPTDGTTSSANVEQQLSMFVTQNSNTTSDDALLFPELDTMCPKGDIPFEKGHHGKGGHGHHGGKDGLDDHHGGIGHKGGFDKPRTKFDSLRLVLPCLQLTAEQDTAVRAILTTLHTQVGSILKATRDAQLPLRQDAQAKAKVVLDSLKAGSITRDEAKAQLDTIRQELETALQPGRDAAKAAITTLQNDALTAIRALLTTSQQVAWDIWISTGQLPC
ncbi:MAG: hypothetical protein K1X91_04065 [Bacteriodetes bacterium]|nr:hypothetical protein [Bacteroidota bacterium]